MKLLAVFIGTVALSWLAGLFLPWWSIAVAAFLPAVLLPQKPFTGFACAFIAVFLLWFALALNIDIHNDHILSGRMSLLVFKKNAPYLIIILSALIGGLVAGLASLSACLLRSRKQTGQYPGSR